MRTSGYLGGNVSMAQRYAMRDRYLKHRRPSDLGARHQCRCGGTVYAYWRKRFYCTRCARWIRLTEAEMGVAGASSPERRT